MNSWEAGVSGWLNVTAQLIQPKYCMCGEWSMKMSILNNLKDFFIPAEVEDENDTGYKTETPEAESSASTSSYSSSASTSSSARRESYTSPYEERRSSSSSASSSAAAVRTVRTSSPTLQVILVKPSEFADAKKIADHLMNNKTVVLVLEDATEATRRRIIDFLVGVAYAQDGNLKPIANQTYIVTPHDVGLVDQLVSELKGTGYSMDSSDSTPIL